MKKLSERKDIYTCPCGKWMVLTPKKAERKRYCSIECRRKFMKRPSGLVYKIVAVNKAWMKAGHEPWNKGLPVSEELKKRWSEEKRGKHYSIVTEFKHGQTKGDQNVKWVGDDVGYGALHTWIHRTYGKACKCDRCGATETKRYHWHNIDLKYTRDITTWEQLCPSCHRITHNNWRNA